LGGVGSGDWYRFDKKTTTGECHSVDVRYLHREGLLNPGHWFFLLWSRAGRETGSIRGVVSRDGRPEQLTLIYRHRSGLGAEWEDVQEPLSPELDSLQLRRTEAVVHLSRRGMRPEGCSPVRTRALLPVPTLLRALLPEPTG
jgi:hypothetical protein